MEDNKALVQSFYDDLWNRWDYEQINGLLTKDIHFRGSLGVVKQGHQGFIDYAEQVRKIFPDFHNTIEELIAEENTVVARLTFRGTHKGELFDRKPTGKLIEYTGVAIFHFKGKKINSVWVLGDLITLMQQIDSKVI